MTPQNFQKLLNLINFDPAWACQNIWGHGRIILVKFGGFGMPGSPSYDHLCVSCWPSFFQFLIYEGIRGVTGPGRYLIFFLGKFPVECRKNHVWGPIFDPSYDHIHKCDLFARIYILIYIPSFSYCQGSAVPQTPARAGGGPSLSTLIFLFFEVYRPPEVSHLFFS